MVTSKILYAKDQAGQWFAIGIISDVVGTHRYLSKTHGVFLSESTVLRLEAGHPLGRGGDGYADFAIRNVTVNDL